MAKQRIGFSNTGLAEILLPLYTTISFFVKKRKITKDNLENNIRKGQYLEEKRMSASPQFFQKLLIFTDAP